MVQIQQKEQACLSIMAGQLTAYNQSIEEI